MNLRTALRATTALVSGFSLGIAPVVAQTPPKSAVFAVAPGATGTAATITVQSGNGQAVPIGVLNPTTGIFSPQGLGAVQAGIAGEISRAQQAEALAFPAASAGTAATRNLGSSVTDPGTGKLEALLPVQTFTATSHAFVSTDLYQETRRTNSGTAMSDTFPASSLLGLVNGTLIQLNNVDTTASLTITAGAGTTINGASTAVVGPGRSTKWVYDAPNANWRSTMNSLSGLLANQIGVAGGVASYGDSRITGAVQAAGGDASGTNATVPGYSAASLALRWGNHLDAKADFGAKFDGTTDDTAAINAGLAKVAAAGGGVVTFPYGSTVLSGLQIPSKVRVTGAGMFATIVKCAGSPCVTGPASTAVADIGLTDIRFVPATAGDVNDTVLGFPAIANSEIGRIFAYGFTGGTVLSTGGARYTNIVDGNFGSNVIFNSFHDIAAQQCGRCIVLKGHNSSPTDSTTTDQSNTQNIYSNINLQYVNGVGFDLVNHTDTNVFLGGLINFGANGAVGVMNGDDASFGPTTNTFVNANKFDGLAYSAQPSVTNARFFDANNYTQSIEGYAIETDLDTTQFGQGLGSISGSTLTVSQSYGGSWAVGDNITGTGVAPGTYITALGTGTGGAGTYILNISQTVASTGLYASVGFVAVNMPNAGSYRICGRRLDRSSGQFLGCLTKGVSGDQFYPAPITPTAGGSFNASYGFSHFFFGGSGVVNGFTINLPAIPPDGTTIHFTSTGSSVTGIVWSTALGGPAANLYGLPTSVSPASPVTIRYIAGSNSWIHSDGSPDLANLQMLGPLKLNIAGGLSAAGTTQATATPLTADISVVTTVASGAGVLLKANVGQRQEVFNRGANPLLVYPASGAQIEATGSNAAVSLAVGAHATFECVSATQCYQAP